MKRLLVIAAFAASAACSGAGPGLSDRIIAITQSIDAKVSEYIDRLQEVKEMFDAAKATLDAASAAGAYKPSQSMTDYTAQCESAANTAALRVKWASEAAAKKAAEWKAATQSVKDETDSLTAKYAGPLAEKAQEVLNALKERYGASPNTADFATKEWCMEHLCPTQVVSSVTFTIECECTGEINDIQNEPLPDGSTASSFSDLRTAYEGVLEALLSDSWRRPEPQEPLPGEDIPE